jgi:hypothetical protein
MRLKNLLICVHFLGTCRSLSSGPTAPSTLVSPTASSTTPPKPTITRLRDRVHYLCPPEYDEVRERTCRLFCYGINCLPTVPETSDPLGISLVSGFYGPGAWTGWLLALCASYVRLYADPYAKLDPNTWLFLTGMNWASVDVFRQIPSLSDPKRSKAEKEKGAGPICG